MTSCCLPSPKKKKLWRGDLLFTCMELSWYMRCAWVVFWFVRCAWEWIDVGVWGLFGRLLGYVRGRGWAAIECKDPSLKVFSFEVYVCVLSFFSKTSSPVLICSQPHIFILSFHFFAQTSVKEILPVHCLYSLFYFLKLYDGAKWIKPHTLKSSAPIRQAT